MKIREDRSHMNIDTRWFEKGYAKEDVPVSYTHLTLPTTPYV